MALSPAEIRNTLEAARQLNRSRQSTQAFILAWTAWEAYNYRFVTAALQMQGLTQADAREVLKQLQSHQSKNMKRIRDQLLLDRPQSTDSVSTIWRQLETDRHHRNFRERRHGLVHGSTASDPRILKRGVDLIVQTLEGKELLQDLRVRIRHGDKYDSFAPAGPILVTPWRNPGSTRGSGTTRAVLDWLR